MCIHLMSIYCIESSMISNLMYALYFTIYKYEICISLLSYVHIWIDSQRWNHIFCSRCNGLGVCAIIIKYQLNYIEIEKGRHRLKKWSSIEETIEYWWKPQEQLQVPLLAPWHREWQLNNSWNFVNTLSTWETQHSAKDCKRLTKLEQAARSRETLGNHLQDSASTLTCSLQVLYNGG